MHAAMNVFMRAENSTVQTLSEEQRPSRPTVVVAVHRNAPVGAGRHRLFYNNSNAHSPTYMGDLLDVIYPPEPTATSCGEYLDRAQRKRALRVTKEIEQ